MIHQPLQPDTPPPHIDFSTLQTTKRLTRWSPLATAVYALTTTAVLLFFAVLSYRPLPVRLLIGVGVMAVIGCGYSRWVFGRTDAGRRARLEDIWSFAEANSFLVIGAQPPTNLSQRVSIRLRLSAIGSSYIRWNYDILLSLHGTYRGNAISLYSLTQAPGTPTDSTLEQDMQYADYTQADNQATITLTASSIYWAAQHPGYGVVVWDIAGISPQNAKAIYKKLWRYNNLIDLQTDGRSLALLLDTNIPYDQPGMVKLFQLLDTIDLLAVATAR